MYIDGNRVLVPKKDKAVCEKRATPEEEGEEDELVGEGGMDVEGEEGEEGTEEDSERQVRGRGMGTLM